ncbi:MAG: AAA family ATPase [Thermoplasmatales archaeon]|nr:MAG: AAA family ATPase [Thermoplasmatales archaeon]
MTSNIPNFDHPYSGARLIKMKFPEPDYLVDDFLARRNLTNLTGPPGGGKTVIAMAIVTQNRTGEVLGRKCKPFRTLFIDEENGLLQTQYQFMRMVKGLLISKAERAKTCENVTFHCMEGFRTTENWVNRLKGYLNDLKKKGKLPDLIIIDNISRTFEGDTNTVVDARMVHRLLKPIAIEYNLAILLLSHTRKGNPTELQDISGSGDFGAQVTIGYITKRYMGVTAETEVNLWFKKVKNNLGRPTGPPESLLIHEVTKDELTLSHQGLVSEVCKKEEKIHEEIKEKIKELLPMKWGDLLANLSGYKLGTVKWTLSKMIKDKEIAKGKDGQWHEV